MSEELEESEGEKIHKDEKSVVKEEIQEEKIQEEILSVP